MKTTELKKLIKEAMKEAIQEELKDILLEAVRAPKTVVNEAIRDTYAQPHIEKLYHHEPIPLHHSICMDFACCTHLLDLHELLATCYARN